MTKKEVIQKIISTLSEQMKSFSFVPSIKDYCFEKKGTDSILYYQFLIYDRTDLSTGNKGFLIEPYIWIHVKEIESYFKEIMLNDVLKRPIDFKTIGNSIAEIVANPYDLHTVWNESLDLFIFEEKNINYVCWELMKHFEKTALPYFHKNATIAAIDKIINVHFDKSIVHSPNDNQRIIKGVIAAKLNNNPRINEIIKLYDKLIIDWDMSEVTREEMNRLKSILPMIGTKIKI